MSESHPLSASDARSIVQLLGNVALVEEDLTHRKQYLIEGLCALIAADSWAWATTFKFDSGEVPLSAGFLIGGFSPEQFSRFQEALEHPDTARLNAHFTAEFERKQCHLTRLRDQIDVNGLFSKSDVHSLWIAAGVEQVILSVKQGRDGALSQVGLYRRPGRPPFEAREARIAHIVLGEVSWLHESVLPASLGPTVITLSRRERITLNLLLEGQSRQQIADHLQLSAHTANGYVKGVFKHFEVHSQSALIARFQRGDGGDIP
jgi:DNA-binding CsgD family transcriptional regulator